MSGGTLYGATVWSPTLIIAQIIAVQCAFYACLGLLAWLLVGSYVPKLTLHQFFDWRWISFRSFTGWMLVVTNVCTAFAAAVALRIVVERSKKCLDFAATLYLIHLLVVWIYSGFPKEFAWWLVNGTGLAVTAVLGEYLCMQKELQEIPISSIRRPDRQRSNGVPAVTELTAVAVRK
ncbi:hypothetical protein N2152v2_004834 [Parachlorella kessleri]